MSILVDSNPDVRASVEDLQAREAAAWDRMQDASFPDWPDARAEWRAALDALARTRPVSRRTARTTYQVEGPADVNAGMRVEVALRDGRVRVVYLDRIRWRLPDARVQARTSGTKIMRAGDAYRALDGTVSAVTEDQAHTHEAARRRSGGSVGEAP